MKRSLSLILTLVMVIGIITSVPVTVSAASEEDFTFESYGSYCYVSASSTDISGEVIIPGEYNGLPVTGVSNFQNCTNITSIAIPDGVKEIGWSAFKGCTNLTTVTIGKDVRDTGMGTFTGCNSLTDIFVDEDNEYHASQDGVLFNKDKTMLIQYPLGKADKVYTIPDDVTDIFQGAFRESVNLESVIISGSVTTIDPFAFAFSNKLKSVIISDSVQSIGAAAFCCPEIKAVAIPSSVTTIGGNAFGYYYSETYELLKVEGFKIYGATGSAAETYANENGFEFIEGTEVIEESVLTFELNEDGESYSVTKCDESASGEIVIPDTYNDLPVTGIGGVAFYKCAGITSVTLGNSVTNIGKFAFGECTSLTSIEIPDSVICIDDGAFYNCVSLNAVYITDVASWCGISFIGGACSPLARAKNLYLNGELVTELVIPNNVTSIGDTAFYGCTSITSVIFGDSVTSIGPNAFRYCSKLETVEIPDNVTSIGKAAFEYCTSLKSVTIGNGVKSIGDYAFSYCTELTSIEIPDSVTSIGEYAFNTCAGLTSVSIGDSVRKIGVYAFFGCPNINAVYITDIANWCNIIFDDYSNPLYAAKNLYLNGELVTDLVIPNSVTSISASAFKSCTSLTSIEIPDSVTSIGGYAFEYCTSLGSITISDSVTSIGDSAFYNTSYYKNSDNWENDVLYIGNHLIEAKTSISGAYTIKVGAKTIAAFAFLGCTGLASIEIPDGVTGIGNSAFQNCTSLTSLEIPDSVTTIGTYAFSGCKNIAIVTIGKGVTSIGSSGFYDCTSITDVYYGGTEADWKKIKISSYNNNLKNATIHYHEHTSSSDWIVTVEPTCTEDGSKHKVCINCGDIVETEKIPANGHNYSTEWTIDVEPNCTEEGSKSRHCTVCGDKADVTAIEAKGHTEVVDEAVAATCTEAGLTEGSHCSACGEVILAQTTVSALGHTSTDWIIDNNSNCTTEGTKFKYCTVCGVTTETGVIAKKEHKAGNWKTTAEATVYKAGEKVKKCTECGEVLDTKAIPQLKCSQPVLKKVYNANDYVKVTWGTVKGADKYYVYRKTGTGGYEFIGSTTNKYFNDKEAGAGKTCRYRIRAKNEAGYSEYSDTLAIKHIDEPTLKSIENSEYGVLIKWDKVTGAEKYNIYRKVSGGDYEYIGVTENTYYTDKTAESGTKYYYAIRGKRDTSVSSQSASLSKYYLEDPTLNTPSSTSKGIGLRWSEVAGAEGYMVYRKAADGSYKLLTTEEGVSNVTFRDTTAKKGTKYYYKVKAYKSKTYSAYSNTKAITYKY